MSKSYSAESKSFKLDIPGSDAKVSVDMELVPAENVPESIQKSSNIAPVNIGGRDFLVLMGKTQIVE